MNRILFFGSDVKQGVSRYVLFKPSIHAIALAPPYTPSTRERDGLYYLFVRLNYLPKRPVTGALFTADSPATPEPSPPRA